MGFRLVYSLFVHETVRLVSFAEILRRSLEYSTARRFTLLYFWSSETSFSNWSRTVYLSNPYVSDILYTPHV